MTHWHAYAYTGRTHRDAEIRKGEAPATYPPFLLRHWLAKPTATIAGTFHDGPEAAEWLRAQLTDRPPLDADAFPIETRIGYALAALAQEAGADVVASYYGSGQQFVSRALIRCPRQETPSPGEQRIRCPQNRP